MGRRSGSAGQVLLALAYGMVAACLMGLLYGFYLVLAEAESSSLLLPFLVGGISAVLGRSALYQGHMA